MAHNAGNNPEQLNMGVVESRRPRSKIVTGIAVVVLVWAAIATLLIGLSTLFSILAPPPPNRAMEAWLTAAETRPGPFVAFLFEFPLIVRLVQIAMFAVMTTAAVGTLRRRNEDRQLLCGVLIFYVLTRATNVYVAVTATAMPKGPNDQADLYEAVITAIIAIVAVLVFRSQAVRSEFDSTRLIALKPRARAPQSAVRSRLASTRSSGVPSRLASDQSSAVPSRLASSQSSATPSRLAPNQSSGTPSRLASSQSSAASRPLAQLAVFLRTAEGRGVGALRRASTWRTLLQLLLAAALIATLVIMTATKDSPYVIFTVAYALLVALLFTDRSPLPSLLSAATAITALAMAVIDQGHRATGMEHLRGIGAFATLNVAIIIVSSLALLLRERPAEHVQPPLMVGEPAVAITAVGRAALVISAPMMVLAANSAMAWFTTTPRLSGVTPLHVPPLDLIGLNTPEAVWALIIGFWTTMVFASIALLQRRMVGAVLLQIGAAILASLRGGEIVVAIASLRRVVPGMWSMLLRMQIFSIVTTAGAIAIIVFLRSPRVQGELRSGGAAAPLPRFAKSEPLKVALQVYSIMYVVGMTLGMLRFPLLGGLPGAMQLWLAFGALLTYDVRWLAVVLAICVAVWTIRATAARTSRPRHSEGLITFLRIGLIAFAVATALQTLVITIPATGNFRTLANTLNPLMIAVLLWIPRTRLLGVAAAGAMFVIWSPLTVARNLPWTLASYGESTLATFFRVPMTILSSVVGICGLIAAGYVFFTYAGRLPSLPDADRSPA